MVAATETPQEPGKMYCDKNLHPPVVFAQLRYLALHALGVQPSGANFIVQAPNRVVSCA